MNDQSQHINHYTAADIQRYLSGNMSASEMHAMEKAALDDPFLADAIEGMEQAMQSHGEAPVNQDLQELRTAIAEKVRPASGKVRRMAWWKITAAAVVVIAAGVFLWNSYISPDSGAVTSKEIAAVQHQEKMQPAIVPPADTLPAPATLTLTDNDNEGLPSTFSTNDKSVAEKTKPSAADARAQADRARNEALDFQRRQNIAESEASRRAQYNALAIQPRANAKQVPLDTNVPATVVPDGFGKKDIVLKSENNPQQFNFSDTVGRPVKTEIVGALQGYTPGLIAQTNAAENKRLNNVIRGRVTDNAQRPIANANVNTFQNPSMNMTYFTDREGYFNIPVRNIDTTSLNVSVAAAGFNSQQFKLSQSPLATNNLQLEPVEQLLNEVIVTGYGKYRSKTSSNKKIKETDILLQNAEPVNGWVSFENYLRENNRLGRDSARAVKDVVVSFVVNRKGELSDFTVTSGSTTEANAEAIRLIREGPAWKIKRGRKSTATVIVHF
ncbi:carboxypeptidase-like regulatory domain-containing protein [Pseudoflavitalea rhizosphaerae]|uniref:carboxypeptidase-like regulatory domain-containing protein n=1 Tax=Pseudoflavitalea rhizosphaerae TaxID=1884793 RepID=UPI000F8F65DA|nr:carboxypeptidase-like regulatory domain-containing protein [Pseudoflavitalea rhizosphaerae]